MAAKITKKELKEPDFLQVAFKDAIDFFSRHRSKFYVLSVVSIICIAILMGWHLYRINYNQSAYIIYDKVGEGNLTDNQSNQEKMVAGYKNVISKYPYSQAAFRSLYKLGNLYFNMGQIDLSLKTYDEFLKKSSNTDYLKVFVYTGKGYSYEVKKDYGNALLSFNMALKMPEGTIFAGQIHRDMGRVYEEMNNRKKSLEHYRASLEKTKDPTMQILIKRKIAELS